MVSPEEHPAAKRYAELPEHVRLFLERLDEKDIASLGEGIALAHAAKTMGRFWKWTFIFMVSAFAGMATIGQAIEWFWTRFKDGS